MNSYMARALELAKQGATRDEVPVGALVVDSATGDILAEAHNRVEQTGNPTQHAEMLVIQDAISKRPVGERLRGCDLYVTLEPCPMCASAISLARIERVYFGAYDPKGGGIVHGPKIFDSSSCHHVPEFYGGIGETECGVILKQFFAEKREPT